MRANSEVETGDDPVNMGFEDYSIVEEIGLPAADVKQSLRELEREGLVIKRSATRKGSSYRLTTDGLAKAKEIRFEATPIAKKRERNEAFREASKTAGIYVGKKALAGVGTIFAALIGFAAFKEQIVEWLKHVLGLR